MPRPPSIQWYYKQWLGDNKVLAMDWDAQAMHFHLLMMSIQEEPAGSIPNDVCQIRRWLRLPSGQSDSDRVWARVQPQIFAAWMLQDGRWFNAGMVETCERRERYSVRYETGTKPERKTAENHCNSSKGFSLNDSTEVKPTTKTKPKPKIPPSIEEVAAYCKERNNQVDPAKWFDFYSSKGWMVGRTRMTNWQAAVRTWERNGYGGPFSDGYKTAAQLRNERAAAAIDRAFAEE